VILFDNRGVASSSGAAKLARGDMSVEGRHGDLRQLTKRRAAPECYNAAQFNVDSGRLLRAMTGDRPNIASAVERQFWRGADQAVRSSAPPAISFHFRHGRSGAASSNRF
jgi:hypothetical protein